MYMCVYAYVYLTFVLLFVYLHELLCTCIHTHICIHIHISAYAYGHVIRYIHKHEHSPQRAIALGASARGTTMYDSGPCLPQTWSFCHGSIAVSLPSRPLWWHTSPRVHCCHGRRGPKSQHGAGPLGEAAELVLYIGLILWLWEDSHGCAPLQEKTLTGACEGSLPVAKPSGRTRFSQCAGAVRNANSPSTQTEGTYPTSALCFLAWNP